MRMKHVFVLDENVYIQSHTCQDVKNGQDDFNSLHLIISILEKCHKIGLNEELQMKYMEKAKMLEKSGKIASAIRVWRNLLYRSDKYVWCESHLKELPSKVEHDRHVIEPTLFLKATLVTTDEKLEKRLNEWGEKNSQDLHITSPEGAVVFLVKLAMQ
jgi:hypothetical protein